ncbi:hypothetical protein B0F90DRAFT_1667103 [Multifurca ochricompacta]|uniref:THUMP domain-containing protein n=1 Tax=Multifurca ochricompacta TaxID=376703 RepID=A0AAD4M711_9AGAM|nr:hypothetical protein B0F90DRAFT_1667103 [Multifurca ochricompacta]
MGSNQGRESNESWPACQGGSRPQLSGGGSAWAWANSSASHVTGAWMGAAVEQPLRINTTRPKNVACLAPAITLALDPRTSQTTLIAIHHPIPSPIGIGIDCRQRSRERVFTQASSTCAQSVMCTVPPTLCQLVLGRENFPTATPRPVDGTPTWAKRSIDGPGIWATCVKGKENRPLANCMICLRPLPPSFGLRQSPPTLMIRGPQRFERRPRRARTQAHRKRENTGVTHTRYTHRLAPVTNTCVANVPEIKSLAQRVLRPFVAQNSDSNFRGWAVNLEDAEVFILVEVFKSVCGIGIVKDYYAHQKFNVMEIANIKNAEDKLEREVRVTVREHAADERGR